MHTATVFTQPAPGLLIARPVQLPHVYNVQCCMHICTSVRNLTDYTMQIYIDYRAQRVVHMTRCITDHTIPPNKTPTQNNVATGGTITIATISSTSHSMSIALHRIHVRITIFPKFFSQLPQGTCSLSVSGMYQYFDEL